VCSPEGPEGPENQERAFRDVTRETPAPGLVVYQPVRGYRYSMEPFLLAAWALEGGSTGRAFDLCCGCGIVGLLLARLGVVVHGFDVDPEWIRLARNSAAESGLAERCTFDLADIRRLEPGDIEIALLNPPYFPAGTGPPSPDAAKDAARVERHGTLSELITAGAGLAQRLCIVVPTRRMDEAADAMAKAGLFLRRRCVCDESLALLEACWAPVPPGGFRDELVSLREASGAWSARVAGWYASVGARLGRRASS
jgi:tRNA1Val (adenine37-N6)-methyltransferase